MNFDNIPIIATAISVVICWSLFAIFCSMIQECVAQLKDERGRFMKNYIQLQLQDFPNGVNWGTMIYNYGSVDLLSRAPEKPTDDIPPHLFAQALIDVVGQSHLVQIHAGKAEEDVILYRHQVLRDFKLATLVLKPSDVVSLFKQSLTSAEITATTVDGIIDESLLYKTLLQNIERWHNIFTDCLGRWYKKKIRQRLFILGIILGLLLNIDSIQLFQVFNRSPQARKVAIDNYKENKASYEALAIRIDSISKQPALVKKDLNSVISSIDSVKELIDSLNAIGQSANLPIGIRYNIFTNWHTENIAVFLLLKVLGVLISGFAASFGAPFWFDLLRKVYPTK